MNGNREEIIAVEKGRSLALSKEFRRISAGEWLRELVTMRTSDVCALMGREIAGIIRAGDILFWHLRAPCTTWLGVKQVQ